MDKVDGADFPNTPKGMAGIPRIPEIFVLP